MCSPQRAPTTHLDPRNKGTLAAFPALRTYTDEFFAQPKIKEYLASHEPLPVNNKSAFLK